MSARRSLSALLLTGVLALGACSSDDTDGGDGSSNSGNGPADPGTSEEANTPTEPVTFHQVTAAAPGECPEVPAPQVAMADPAADECLVLEPAAMTVTEFESVEAQLEESVGSWVINVTLAPSDAEAFGALTAEVADLEPPQNRIAMVLGDDELLMAPTVLARIGGDLQISANYDEDEAQEIAEALGG